MIAAGTAMGSCNNDPEADPVTPGRRAIIAEDDGTHLP